MILQDNFHTPVLLGRVLENFGEIKTHKFIDCTLGGGGYSLEIIRMGGIVLGIDRDNEALKYALLKYRKLKGKNKLGQLVVKKGNFKNIKKIAEATGFAKVKGIIFDLGLSSYQIDKSNRGFSYLRDEPLDMRMDPNQEISAWDIINNFSKERLNEIFVDYSEEINSGPISQAIIRTRALKKINSTMELKIIIRNCLIQRGEGSEKNIKGTVARIFQAVRMQVNSEIGNLKEGLNGAWDLIAHEGLLQVISYHSLEDRIVKLFMSEKIRDLKGSVKNKSIVKADYSEIRSNIRARSAKLRFITKK